MIGIMQTSYWLYSIGLNLKKQRDYQLSEGK